METAAVEGPPRPLPYGRPVTTSRIRTAASSLPQIATVVPSTAAVAIDLTATLTWAIVRLDYTRRVEEARRRERTDLLCDRGDPLRRRVADRVPGFRHVGPAWEHAVSRPSEVPQAVERRPATTNTNRQEGHKTAAQSGCRRFGQEGDGRAGLPVLQEFLHVHAGHPPTTIVLTHRPASGRSGLLCQIVSPGSATHTASKPSSAA